MTRNPFIVDQRVSSSRRKAFSNILALLVGAALLLSVAPSALASPAGCSPTFVSVDTAGADTVLLFDQGRGMGQVLLVKDTLVSSVTFWIPHRNDADFVQGFLYITGVDSNGIARYFPLNGPDYYASELTTPPYGDGIHMRQFTFTIDPPAALPKPGRYFFDLSEGTCFGAIRLLGRKGIISPSDGWETGASDCDGRGSGSPFGPGLPFDTCVTVTFCGTATPVRSSTWGELKTRYR